jgi:creatinine amidohydrolase
MPEGHDSRIIGHLVFGEVKACLRKTSVLCLPMGSMEQHGPHLPLDTDSIIAEAVTARVIARWGKTHDLWQLPPVPFGLSREHAWAPGTVSLTVSAMTGYLRNLAGELSRTLPARNLLIVNGHGGNRGILDALAYELKDDFGFNVATMHLGAMMSPGTDRDVPEIHAGKDETSVMLALAPELVRRKALAALKPAQTGEALRALVLDPAASYPWSSGDKRLAAAGVMGDARGASPAHGEIILKRMVDDAGKIIRRLKSNAARGRA